MTACNFRTLLAVGLMFVSSIGLSARAEAPEAINLRKTTTVHVVEQTKDAVVFISTSKFVPERVPLYGGDPFFERIGPSQIVERPAGSLGSGFIVHAEGYVVTNNHVIDGARSISVELLDGRKLPADVVSADTEADLAVLKIEGDKPFPHLELGDSSDLMIGEPVIAVGNPLGFSHSVSTGIVSAIHRDLKAPDDRVLLSDLIQTDAAINPGNSGGPLLNAYGQVIGINTAVRGDAQNIGFAIQINKMRALIPTLMNPAVVKKVEVKVQLEEKRKLSPPSTVTPSIEVVRGDGTRGTVKSIDGVTPRNIIEAYAILLKAKVGHEVKIHFAGDEKPLVVKAEAAAQPDAIVQARKKLGLVAEPVTPMLAQKLGLRTESGMFITEVTRDSIAARAGIQAGDVIVKLGPYPVSSLEDFGTLIDKLPETGRIRVTVLRGNRLGSGIFQLG